MKKTRRLIVVRNATLRNAVWFTQDEPVTFAVRPPASSSAWQNLLWGLRMSDHQLVLPVNYDAAKAGGRPRLEAAMALSALPFHSVALLGLMSMLRAKASYLPGVKQFASDLFAQARGTSRKIIPIVDNQQDHGAIMGLPPRVFRETVWPIHQYELTITDCLNPSE